MRLFFLTLYLFSVLNFTSEILLAASLPLSERLKNYKYVESYVKNGPGFKSILAPEGEFVRSFNESIDSFIATKVDTKWLEDLNALLEKNQVLDINLTERGFASAAERQTEGNDETNYDAIWVRDSIWIYHYFRMTGQQSKAKKLLFGIWDYYSTKAQRDRFSRVIQNPELRHDPMEVPHIRFDGSSPGLEDVIIDGKPQLWNHKQMDAHGLFFEAILRAELEGDLKPSDWTSSRIYTVGLLPLFFEKVDFSDFEESGAWEELDRKNTSSIGIVARALNVAMQVSHRFNQIAEKNSLDLPSEAIAAFQKSRLNESFTKGLNVVKRQLQLGGESPDYANPASPKYRRADAALMNLVIPYSLPGLKEEDLRLVTTIMESLKGPFGILRYDNDSYQSGNYWIADPKTSSDQEEIEAIAISEEGFLARFKNLVPGSEAQWFFDSKLAWIRLELASKTQDPVLRAGDIRLAKIHIKRALGMMTGNRNNRQLITADGRPVDPFLMTESINTVVIDGVPSYLPSPISPLNWSKAGIGIALHELEKFL